MESQNRDEDTVEETLPERDARGPQATDLADIPETLPECPPRENESAEQAGDLFNVSGRTVRDAQKAP